ncbi:hypothetical protein A6V36_30355 [Paraburkholderia ginsengiterrae]|uniref:DNA-binding protein n=1 Tax=Paraburkholderia ginsengiterrae TaxID=1462993 RepID=A0A1A9N336_9BURK|nr:OB-fold domain-containing protein [Paraburkholderia ginsengiterrae]OAJ55992.1 hypothetical protein A6V37_32265 [Paraburkholderia ginsengiterrae]OAJ58551.1 hypothetical protein A6V36_30355 [Paraburkholderia ginsengiterrae]
MNQALEQLKVPGPIPNRYTQPFWDGTAKEQFMLQHCDDCSHWVFYPRSHCPHCWSRSLSWKEASGLGKVKSFTDIHRPGHPAWEAVTPYTVALIRLDEGPTMLSTVIDTPRELLTVGQPVKAAYVKVGEFVLPMFRALTRK